MHQLAQQSWNKRIKLLIAQVVPCVASDSSRMQYGPILWAGSSKVEDIIKAGKRTYLTRQEIDLLLNVASN